ncbi:hypothetical protein J6590_033822 [Homalodisca vitripennis]|nr:hypothetical protein J6590_033822 [Homalodisca vitripennis]
MKLKKKKTLLSREYALGQTEAAAQVNYVKILIGEKLEHSEVDKVGFLGRRRRGCRQKASAGAFVFPRWPNVVLLRTF